MKRADTRTEHQVVQGIETWRNAKNKFFVFQIHYTANPAKRTADFRDTIHSSMPRAQALQEYELHWDSFAGLPVFQDFDKTLHFASPPIRPEAGLPLLRGWDFGLCYGASTEVLTESGWKFFKDVDIKKDRVATLDPNTFEMTYKFPTMKVDQPFRGEMIHWDNTSARVTITPDHIVPVWSDTGKLQRYYAKDLFNTKKHVQLRRTFKWSGKDIANPFGMSPEIFGAFMGTYLSEGSLDKKRVSIYQNKDHSWINAILKKTPWSWHESEEVFRTTDAKLSEYLKSFGTQEKRFIPPEIRHGSCETIKAFIDAYTLGDGSVRTRKNGAREHTIFSTSKHMIDDLSELASKLSWSFSITEVKPSRSYYAAEKRYICSKGGWTIAFKKRSDFSEVRNLKMSKVPYRGHVYCLQVPNNMLFVREGGRAHWNGNTPACVICQLQGEVLVVLKEFTEVNMGAERFATKVLAQCANLYPNWPDQKEHWRDFIDPSGEFRKDTDEGTCAKILDAKGLHCMPGAIAFEERRGAVENFLIKRSRAGAAFKINAEECPVLVRGFLGGYRYTEKALDIEPSKLRPLKNEFSHIHDALQMVATRIIMIKGKSKRKVPTLSYGN